MANGPKKNSLNFYNQLFYKHADPRLKKAFPNLFTSLSLFHQALFSKIAKSVKKDPIKIKESASGGDPGIWKSFIEFNRVRNWEILLTEFSEDVLTDSSSLKADKDFEFSKGVENLTDDLIKLKKEERYDVIFSSYAFDSIWFPEDFHLIKKGGKWFSTSLLVEFPEEYKEIIKKQEQFDRDFFKNIKIEKRIEEIDLEDLKHGRLIRQYYKDVKEVRSNFPGGLIDKTIESFKKQISSAGMFITADMAIVKKGKPSDAYQTVQDIVKIKVEDYGLAKYILETIGYKVELRSLQQFIKDEGVETPVDIHDHFVLTIQKSE